MKDEATNMPGPCYGGPHPYVPMPQEQWIEVRKLELARAIHEYLQSGRQPKWEWLEELCGLFAERAHT